MIALFSLLLITNISYALIIGPDTIISSDTIYNSMPLDFSAGNIIIKNNAKLTINNCNIVGNIGPANPTLIQIQSGKLEMNNDDVKLSAVGIIPHPQDQSLEYFIRLNIGSVSLNNNSFWIDQQFSAGLFLSEIALPHNDFVFSHNTFTNFHCVLYLLNVNNANINHNIFKLNSYGHIVLTGTNSNIDHNFIYFSGLNQVGNAIDIVDSDTVSITENVIFTPTCHGIYVIAGHHLLIDGNSITGGITYAMNIISDLRPLSKDAYALKMIKKRLVDNSSDIIISNNFMGQNRYGIQADGVNNLTIINNYFTQRFLDAVTRKFWTDNNLLLQNITNLIWMDNFYKEAFTQENGGDNSNTQFVIFPQSGGVVI